MQSPTQEECVLLLFLDLLVRVSFGAFNKVLTVPISPHGASPVCPSHKAKDVKVADFAPCLVSSSFTRV